MHKHLLDSSKQSQQPNLTEACTWEKTAIRKASVFCLLECERKRLSAKTSVLSIAFPAWPSRPGGDAEVPMPARGLRWTESFLGVRCSNVRVWLSISFPQRYFPRPSPCHTGDPHMDMLAPQVSDIAWTVPKLWSSHRPSETFHQHGDLSIPTKPRKSCWKGKTPNWSPSWKPSTVRFQEARHPNKVCPDEMKEIIHKDILFQKGLSRVLLLPWRAGL